MANTTQSIGGYEPPKPNKPENIFEATAKRNKEKAAKDPAFARRLALQKLQAEFQGDEPLQQ